jgi:hypothetical protein
MVPAATHRPPIPPEVAVDVGEGWVGSDADADDAAADDAADEIGPVEADASGDRPSVGDGVVVETPQAATSAAAATRAARERSRSCRTPPGLRSVRIRGLLSRATVRTRDTAFVSAAPPTVT